MGGEGGIGRRRGRRGRWRRGTTDTLHEARGRRLGGGIKGRKEGVREAMGGVCRGMAAGAQRGDSEGPARRCDLRRRHLFLYQTAVAWGRRWRRRLW